MKLVKSLLLGSAAGLSAVAGAQAADLPMRKAAPVEYVRVCTAMGAGFFYIPGTDTCIRIGGRARFEYNYVSSGRSITPNAGGANATGNLANGDVSSMRGVGRLSLDTRTATAYGTLRAFVRLDILSASGGYLVSGTGQRAGTSFPALGQDTFGRAGTTVSLDRAFVQWGPLTAGRTQSFFDFYTHDVELIGASSGSDRVTHLAALTAMIGNGFSATISAEDGLYRRQPIFSNATFGGVGGAVNIAGGVSTATAVTGSNQSFVNLGAVYASSTIVAPGVVSNLDVVQRDRLPDFVGNLRYDGPWGAAQVSAAVHEIFLGKYFNTQTFTATGAGGFPAQAALTTVPSTPFAAAQPGAQYGYAVQGGLKINLPQLAAGDVLWLQAAYTDGAMNYAFPHLLAGTYSPSVSLSRFAVSANDAFVTATGKLKMTEVFSVQGAFLHYWTPEWRSAVYGSYADVSFGKGARSNTVAGPASLIAAAGSIAATQVAYSTTLRDYSVSTVGANLIWSPVRDLDIGVEGLYQRFDLKNGVTSDGNKALGSNALGVPLKTVKYDDVFLGRFRVQRDF